MRLDFLCSAVYVNVTPERVAGPRSHEQPGPGATRRAARGRPMLKNFEDFQKLGKDNVDVALKQFGTVSKGWQAIATEFADYSKKSFEDGSAALEKLFGAKTLEKAIEVQSDYVKTAYEGFVAEATKFGELYTDLAKESYKPLEGMLAKVAPTK
jgi:hypothetical protein